MICNRFIAREFVVTTTDIVKSFIFTAYNELLHVLLIGIMIVERGKNSINLQHIPNIKRHLSRTLAFLAIASMSGK